MRPRPRFHLPDPRLIALTFISLLLMLGLALVRPEQLQVVLYKSGLVTLGAVLGFWLDWTLFPYLHPSKCAEPLIASAMLRRALVVTAAILGLTLGL
jgi:hypothetical protein